MYARMSLKTWHNEALDTFCIIIIVNTKKETRHTEFQNKEQTFPLKLEVHGTVGFFPSYVITAQQ